MPENEFTQAWTTVERAGIYPTPGINGMEPEPIARLSVIDNPWIALAPPQREGSEVVRSQEDMQADFERK